MLDATWEASSPAVGAVLAFLLACGRETAGARDSRDGRHFGGGCLDVGAGRETTALLAARGRRRRWRAAARAAGVGGVGWGVEREWGASSGTGRDRFGFEREEDLGRQGNGVIFPSCGD